MADEAATVPGLGPLASRPGLLGHALIRIGRATLFIVSEMGRMLLFLLATLGWLFRPPFRPLQVLKQLHFIGFKSTFVVILTAAFTGMVLGLQGYYTLRKFGSEA